MSPHSTLILRFRSPDGTFRVQVEPRDSVSTLRAKVPAPNLCCIHGLTMTKQLAQVVPKNAEPTSFVLSDKPANGQTRALSEILSNRILELGLK